MENDEGDLRRRIGDDVVESNVHIVNNEDDNDNDGEIKVDKIIPIVVEEEEENANNSNTNGKDANNNNNTNNDNKWQINILPSNLPSNNEDQLPYLNEYNTRIRDILIIFVNPISGNQER